MRVGLGACVLTLAATLATSAGAQESASTDSTARADSLFREAEQFFRAGEIAGACARLAESHRLDPALGTLINLALCHERQGRTATAMTELHEALATAKEKGQTERQRLLTEEI